MPLLRSAENRWLQALTLVLFVGFVLGGDGAAAESNAAVQANMRLAIAPVTVDSESEHKEFAQALPKDLGRHLLRDGRVGLVPLSDVRETLASFEGGHLGAAELRGFASKLDANFIAVWRLYESAEKLRLVMFLVPADNSAAKVQRLELKADDEEKLAAQIPKLAETVERLLFEPEPAPETTAAPAPEPAEKTSPEEARAATPSPSAQNRIASIRVRGNQRIDARAIRARMVTREGDAIDPQHIARDIHSIYQLGFFRDVNIFRDSGPEGWVLTVVVHENPVIQEIAIDGNKKVESEDIKDVLTLTTGAVLDHTLLRENIARIESLYHTKGFYLAKISYSIAQKAEGFISVDFEIEEGKKLHLRKIRFEGNEFLSDRKLRKGLKTKPWHFWSYLTSFLTHEGTYAEAIFGQDLRDISQRYSDEGFLRVDIGEPQVEITKKGIELRVNIDEGDRYRVGVIDVAGDETVDLPTLRRDLQLKQGDIFNRSALTEDVEKLTGHYTDRGFYFANVSPETNLKQGELVVDVTYDVEKGPLYFIRNIEFSGNTTTVDPVLRREMSLVEGELYSARELEVSRKRLKGLGFFEEVDFEPKPTDAPGQLDLTAKVVERPTGSFSLGAGFSSQEGAIFTGSLSQSNLFGRGYGLRFSADLGSSSNRFYISFSNPYLLGSEYSLVSTVFRSEVSFEDFQQRSQGFSFVFGHPLNEERTARGFLGYNLSDIEIDESSISVAQAAPILRERVQGSKVTSALTLSYRSNTLDDFLSPSEGAQVSGSLEVAGLGGFSKYARIESSVRYFIPGPRWMPKRSTFMVGASAGYAEPFNKISDWDLPGLTDYDLANAGGPNPDPSKFELSQIKQLDEIDDDLQLPLSERYFLGGLGRYQLRGYKARSLGPRRAILKPVGNGSALYTTLDRNTDPDRGPIGACLDRANNPLPPERCNRVTDKADSDFANLNLTDVVGGNKFISMTGEYRFSISEAMGLVGVLFIDGGNAFAEGDSLFDVGQWRYGTGVGVQWFSPFGPLQAFYGIPLNKNEVEDASVFEFSMGGSGF